MLNPITVLRSAANMVWNATVSPEQRVASQAPPQAAPRGLANVPDTAGPAAPSASKPFFLIRWFSWLLSCVPSMPWKRQPPATPAAAPATPASPPVPNPTPQPALPQNPVVDHKPQMLQMLRLRVAADPSPEVLQDYQNLGARIGNGSITPEELEATFANIDQVRAVLNQFQGLGQAPIQPQAPVIGQQERELMLQMLGLKIQGNLPDGFREHYEAFRYRIENEEISLNELIDAFDFIDTEREQAQLDAGTLAQALAASVLDPQAAQAPAQISLKERELVLQEFDARLQPPPPEEFVRRYQDVAQSVGAEVYYITDLGAVRALLAPIDQDLAQYRQNQAQAQAQVQGVALAAPAEQGTSVDDFLKVNEQFIGLFCNCVPGMAARPYRMGHIPNFIRQFAVGGNLVNPKLEIVNEELLFTHNGSTPAQLDMSNFAVGSSVQVRQIVQGYAFFLPKSE